MQVAILIAQSFYMDMRTPGKEFEKYYQNAKDKHGINFIRSKVHSVTEDSQIQMILI